LKGSTGPGIRETRLGPDADAIDQVLAGGVDPYHLLRAASERFGMAPGALSAAQRREVEHQARRTYEIERRVLASQEASSLVIPPALVETAVAQIRSRYPDGETFAADLGRNDLDPDTLAAALRRELTFDAVMQRVAARHPEVDEIDVRLYYELHPARFTSPERRLARHILITVNDAFPENRRDIALARIERLSDQLRGSRGVGATRFGALARRHSECPTALEDGRLGEVRRGQLYPQLDALLFRLAEGQAGGPVESELGLHLLYCERIHKERILPFSKAQDRIRRLLLERQRRDCQRAWLADLQGAGGQTGGVAAEALGAP